MADDQSTGIASSVDKEEIKEAVHDAAQGIDALMMLVKKTAENPNTPNTGLLKEVLGLLGDLQSVVANHPLNAGLVAEQSESLSQHASPGSGPGSQSASSGDKNDQS